MERRHAMVSIRDEEGRARDYPMDLLPSEAALSELREPQRFPVLSMVRSEILSWRFFHEFRKDANSPIREPRIGVRAPVLHHDGSNLAAALQTIYEIGDGERLVWAVARAFPGAALEIEVDGQRFQVAMRMPGFQRTFQAKELSDGTLQYLCLLAALLSPRPPTLLALNEPESSIHPDLYEPLAELIVDASRNSQLWITTHARELAELIEKRSGYSPIQLEKKDGQTRIVGRMSFP
jgi:predicted ATPase